MTLQEFSELCEALDALLVAEGFASLRFALVIWDHQGNTPKCSASNEASASRVLHMLESSRQRIIEMGITSHADTGRA